jgi:hypothetical protein
MAEIMMGGERSTAGWSPFGWRRAWLSVDRNPRALAFATTRPGIAVLHVAFLALLGLSQQTSTLSLGLIASTLVMLAVAPAWRWHVLGLAGVAYLCARPLRLDEQAAFVDGLRAGAPGLSTMPPTVYAALAAIAFLAAFWMVIRALRARPTSYVMRRPVLCQIAFLFALIALGLWLRPGSAIHAIVWTLASMLGASFFFLSYVLTDERARNRMPDAAALGYVRPFWGGPSIPFKSPAYLKRFEATDAEALARTRLKAVKLIVWAAILHVAHQVGVIVIHGEMAVMTLSEALGLHAQSRYEIASAEGEPRAVGVVMNWAALLASFILGLLQVAVMMHAYVAIVRMAGFCIPRGMARPLSARSIAEFWNRYLYYFKEVLVDFFFYPAFTRYFKQHPRLRIAFATFCAAFVGNILFSVIWNAYNFGRIGPLETLWMLQNYVFYAAILTTGLVASQLIKRKPQPEDGLWRYDVMPRIRVIGFFCLCTVFVDEIGYLTVADRLSFFLSLFGL